MKKLLLIVSTMMLQIGFASGQTDYVYHKENYQEYIFTGVLLSILDDSSMIWIDADTVLDQACVLIKIYDGGDKKANMVRFTIDHYEYGSEEITFYSKKGYERFVSDALCNDHSGECRKKMIERMGRRYKYYATKYARLDDVEVGFFKNNKFVRNVFSVADVLLNYQNPNQDGFRVFEKEIKFILRQSICCLDHITYSP